jgi:phage-related tail fiber protein
MTTYKTIHTTYGLQRMAQAEATGIPINLVAMAVGDGNGNAVNPTEGQTQLVREIAATRAAPNRIYQDSNDPTMFIAELVIPATINGFTMREWGIFDDAGGLFAVGNLPATYKPMPSEGLFADTVLRVQFKVTNASVVTILVDPNVAVATQAWVLNLPNPYPGGLTGQVLKKDSNADGDASWHDPTTVNVVVSTIEETQTLAANQTTVDLVVTNTTGLAVYIEGVRLPRDDTHTNPDAWWPHATIATKAILGKSYPAGHKLIAVQNEPASHLEAALQQDQNLNDLQDKAVARTNLGVYSKDESDRLAPASEVSYFARNTAPPGWLKANGAAVSRVAYAALFAAIGTTYGAGDGFNTFNLPDLRGEFLRAWDDSRGVDANRTLGSWQTSQNLAHSHGGSTDTSGSHAHGYTDGRPTNPAGNGLAAGSDFPGVWESVQTKTTDTAGSHSHGITTTSSGGNEARPRNVALLACIKF